MYISDHGGECCGIHHIVGFEHRPTETLLRSLDRHLNTWRGREYSRHSPHDDTWSALLEATLTDNQMANGWAEELKKRGFRLVTRFKNSNSGNHVSVLHYLPVKSPKKRPFTY